MEAILKILAQKLIINLMHSANKTAEEAHSRIVEMSLEVLSQYITSTMACKSLAQIPEIRQLATTHIN